MCGYSSIFLISRQKEALYSHKEWSVWFTPHENIRITSLIDQTVRIRDGIIAEDEKDAIFIRFLGWTRWSQDIADNENEYLSF